MKIFFFSMSLVLVTSAQAAKLTFAWDKKEIDALKRKEVYSAYCNPKTGGFAKEVCDRVSNNSSFKKFKFKTLEWVDSTTIRAGDGPRTVEVKHGALPGSFVMNGKTFQFGAESHDEIRRKIAAAIPRVAQTFFFLNTAYAEEPGNVVVELSDAIDLMVSQESDKARCKIAQDIMLLCEDKGSVMPGTENVISAMKNYLEQKTPSGHARAAKDANAAIENFRNLIEDARNFISGSHKLQRSGCYVDYKGMTLQTEDAAHLCNGFLENFKIDFDNGVLDIALNDAMKRATHKDLRLRYNELTKQLETFYNRRLYEGEKQKVQDALRTAR